MLSESFLWKPKTFLSLTSAALLSASPSPHFRVLLMLISGLCSVVEAATLPLPPSLFYSPPSTISSAANVFSTAT
ncbi:hypothetical protein TorRG33x02_202550 [Trema orientale]|uniref:Uncharacterized protein n=1 Tax=Trema orientale TaxID=63057 RepID=A0A2P5EEJ7_TREOI|nr:hypothetical protein TorRG33x02_202550 [Trema orientale]